MASMLERLKALVSGVREIGATFKALNADLAKLRERRTWLAKAPRPRACTLAALDRFVDQGYQSHFDAVAAKVVGEIRQRPCDQVADFRPGGFDLLKELSAGHALNYLLTATLKAELHRVIETTDWPAAAECGPPARERAAEIAKLDKQIADLEAELNEVREAADQSGVMLER